MLYKKGLLWLIEYFENIGIQIPMDTEYSK